MKNLLKQLALNSTLLPEDLAAAILTGNMPPTEEIVMALVVGGIDALAVTMNDPKLSWSEKRLARIALAAVFLAAMALVGGRES